MEENTSDLVEPPTEEEMRRAITGNMSNLLVVVSLQKYLPLLYRFLFDMQMKAVKKFKTLLTKRRPELLESILGQQARIFQPPLTMDRNSSKQEPLRSQKAHSVDSHDRKPIEQALAREGVHRPIDTEKINYHITQRDDTTSTGREIAKPSPSPHPASPHVASPPPADGSSSPFNAKPSPISKPPLHTSTLNEHKLYGKGQAHDPLSDSFLFLEIGPSSNASPTDGNSPNRTPTVSESPPAAEGNIYEMAYHEEVERIRRNSRSSTLYLTRRIKNTEKYKGDGNMKGVDERHEQGATGWGKMLQIARGKQESGEGDEHAKEKKRKIHDEEEGTAKTEGGLKRFVEKMKHEGKLHEKQDGAEDSHGS